MLRCLTSIGSATEREQEQELIDSLSDKSAIPQAIKDYRHQIGIGNRKMHEYINETFAEKPILSERAAFFHTSLFRSSRKSKARNTRLR